MSPWLPPQWPCGSSNYGYVLLLPKNQRVFSKLSMEQIINGKDGCNHEDNVLSWLSPLSLFRSGTMKCLYNER